MRDMYGNLTTIRQYDYNKGNSPFKVTSNTYLTDSAYLSRNIFNRLVSASVSDGVETTELWNYKYDTIPLVDRPGVPEHDDANYGVDRTVRGNATEIIHNGIYKSRGTYDITGLPASLEKISTEEYYDLELNADSTNAGMNLALNAGANDAAALIKSKWKEYKSEVQVITGPNGKQTLVSHDAGNRTTTIVSENGWQKVALDGFGRITTIQKGNGQEITSTVEYSYDSQATGGNSKGRRGGRSAFIKLKQVSLPHSPNAQAEWIKCDYDSLGRPVNTGKKKRVYRGNSTLVMDDAGGWKKFVSRADGKLQKIVTPNPQSGPDLETLYRYNLKGRLAGVTMPRLDGTQKREFLSTPDNLQKTITHPESGAKTRNFNVDGTLASRTDAKGQRVVYSYDDQKHIVAVNRFDANGMLQPAQCVTYSYNSNPYDPAFSQNCNNRLAAIRWGSPDVQPGVMTEMYSYNSSGKLTAKRFRINRGGKDIDLDLQFSYDENGRISTITYPNGAPHLNYAYDDTGRPIQMMSGSDVLIKDVSYDAATNRLASYKHLMLNSGEYLEQQQQFDSQLRVSRIIAGFEKNPDPIMDIEYGYDDPRRLAAKTDHVSNTISNYEYDESGRLTNAEDGNCESSFNYDGLGNLVSQKNDKGAASEMTVTHDSATNRIVSNSVKYDDNGNIIKLFDMDLSFDIENRLVAIDKKDAGAEQYAYNPQNLRIWKKLATGDEEIHFYGKG
jgi:YD repeat-containing protein